MAVFNGTARIRVVEARDLRPTEWSKRFNTANNEQMIVLDAYVNVDCDEYHVGQTLTKPKTCAPVWNEDYQVCTGFMLIKWLFNASFERCSIITTLERFIRVNTVAIDALSSNISSASRLHTYFLEFDHK